MASSDRYSRSEGGEIGERAAAAASAVADRASRAADAARSAAADFRDRASDALDSARDVGWRAARSASRQVEAHPFSSVGVAFVAGLVLGIAIDRLMGSDD